jgi:hypothetical protein
LELICLSIVGVIWWFELLWWRGKSYASNALSRMGLRQDGYRFLQPEFLDIRRHQAIIRCKANLRREEHAIHSLRYLLLERVKEGTMNLNNLIASMHFTTAAKIWAYKSSELLAEVRKACVEGGLVVGFDAFQRAHSQVTGNVLGLMGIRHLADICLKTPIN